MARLIQADSVLIEAHETFPRQTIRNRFEIMTSQGRFRLSVPLSGRRNHSKTHEILVDPGIQWRTKLWRSITTAYGSAPYFEHYEEQFRSMLFNNEQRLLEYNTSALRSILAMLKTKKELAFTEEYHSSHEGYSDFREQIGADHYPKYIQVFEDRFSFSENLSVIDLVFNSGPSSLNYLMQL